MPILKNKYQIIAALSNKLLSMLTKGDMIIQGEVVYFEPHATLAREKAVELYHVFENWALSQDPPEEISDHNFFRILFSTVGRLKAKKKIIVKVAQDCAVVLLLPLKQYT